ncbi:hypothetical protein IQ269_22485 [Tychonema sp. LEGE 07199]|uniref:hypothetical protein n=1 Tax=unclassified Tychonema TaxID=2642144 RepID=UPI0018829B13|nr:MULTISPECIES: hypothetical protein [unclassified Tychonema]MBE9123490.1 hypothetical protein [Tychonema sp. LEGE 07199]MBE9131166.1 hypothetical protein [Tychonema sp. LEGE 07196]
MPFPCLAERLAGSARPGLKGFAFWEQKKPSGQEPEGRRCLISSTTKSLIPIVATRGDRPHLSNG